jgi:hypothetical protein
VNHEQVAVLRGQVAFAWADFFSVIFSSLFALMFVAEYVLNASSDDFSNYYRYMYGLLPTLLPLFVRWMPSTWWPFEKATTFFCLVCLAWYAYLMRLEYDSYSYVGLTSIAVLSVVFLYFLKPSGQSQEQVGASRFYLPRGSSRQTLLLMCAGLASIAAFIYSGSGIAFLWMVGLLLISIVFGTRWRSWKGVVIILCAVGVFIAYVLPVLSDGEAGLDLIDSDEYLMSKVTLSPRLFAFFVNYFLSTNIFARSVRSSNIFFPNSSAAEFEFAGDFGWSEYVFEFGIIALLALVFNFWSFLRALRLPQTIAVFAAVCLWWTFFMLNAHYGIFFNLIGLISFVFMLYGLKVLANSLMPDKRKST